jgi:hypothetical protein
MAVASFGLCFILGTMLYLSWRSVAALSTTLPIPQSVSIQKSKQLPNRSARLSIALVTEGKSGSTVLSELFNQREDTWYLFEPLQKYAHTVMTNYSSPTELKFLFCLEFYHIGDDIFHWLKHSYHGVVVPLSKFAFHRFWTKSIIHAHGIVHLFQRYSGDTDLPKINGFEERFADMYVLSLGSKSTLRKFRIDASVHNIARSNLSD